MAKKYRIKPFFGSHQTYRKTYVIQKKGIWFWHTISPETANSEQVEKDCQEAQELYDKYNNI